MSGTENENNPPQENSNIQSPLAYMTMNIKSLIDDKKGLKIKFNDKHNYHDIWATFIFFLTIALTITIFVINVEFFNINDLYGVTNDNSLNNEPENIESSEENNNTELIVMLVSGIGSAGLSTLLYVYIIQKYSYQMVKISFIISITMVILYGIFFFVISPFFRIRVVKYLGMIMIPLAIIFGLLWYYWKAKIPFARVMIKTVLSIATKYPSIFLIGYIGSYFSTLWYSLIIVSISAILCTIGTQNIIIIFLELGFIIFSLYFTSQVINNVVHVTISGVFSTFYFCGRVEPTTKKIVVDAKNPTYKSFKRSLSSSLGSICFGSLIISLMKILSIFVFILRRLFSRIKFIKKIYGVLESLNIYGLIEVAIYGKAYCEAARDTWKVCKPHGINVLISNNIVGKVFTVMGITVGILSDLVTISIGIFALKISSSYVLVFYGTLSFITGLMIFLAMCQVVNAGINTTFVCICEDPEAIRYTKPDYYKIVKETFPSLCLYD